jgi:hypothetical protein
MQLLLGRFNTERIVQLPLSQAQRYKIPTKRSLGFRYFATDMNLDTRTAPVQSTYKSITERIPMGRWGTPDDFRPNAANTATDIMQLLPASDEPCS